MGNENTGGPAFPSLKYEETDGAETFEMASFDGMTLLDYFAAVAMASLFCREDARLNCTAIVSERSYKMARAMMKEREKGKQLKPKL